MSLSYLDHLDKINLSDKFGDHHMNDDVPEELAVKEDYSKRRTKENLIQSAIKEKAISATLKTEDSITFLNNDLFKQF